MALSDEELDFRYALNGRACPACGGELHGFALRCARCFPERPFFAKAISEAADQVAAQIGIGIAADVAALKRCTATVRALGKSNVDQVFVGVDEGREISGASFVTVYVDEAKHVPIDLVRRAALTESDEGVHRAIAAMQRASRANEL